MATAYYLTHPQVAVDPGVPVPQWGLSPLGRSRATRCADAEWTSGVGRIIASAEQKALETAEIIAGALGLTFESDPAFNENERSATGYLPESEFEATADAFFAAPDQSIRGWERATDAQARIVTAVDQALAQHTGGDVLFVGHGAVGTLLLCHCAGIAISRDHDQPAGGGNLFAFDVGTRRVLSGWRPVESWDRNTERSDAIHQD